MSCQVSETIVGLDVGGTKTAVVEGTRRAEILQRDEAPTEAARPFDETFPALAPRVARTLRRAAEAGRSVAALSVSVGGPLRIVEGALLDPPHLPGSETVWPNDSPACPSSSSTTATRARSPSSTSASGAGGAACATSSS